MGVGKNGNLIPLTERSPEEALEIRRKGAEARNRQIAERKALKETLEMLITTQNESGKTYQETITMGLIANATNKAKGGNPRAYETIARILGELADGEEKEETKEPIININVVDNSKLEKEFKEEQ